MLLLCAVALVEDVRRWAAAERAGPLRRSTPFPRLRVQTGGGTADRQTMTTEPAQTVHRFTCPTFCNARGDTESHASAEEITHVVHYGPGQGLGVMHHDMIHGVGFDATTVAFTLPDGSPGRPFLRVAGDDAEYFDIHDLDVLRTYQQKVIRHLAFLARHLTMMEAWDQEASPAERTQHQEMITSRPCTGSVATGQSHAQTPPPSSTGCCPPSPWADLATCFGALPDGCPHGCAPHDPEADQPKRHARRCATCSADLCTNCRRRPVRYAARVCGVCGGTGS
ncbi:hypothetical protein ADK43_39960 [Streptomyces rimosus subsp. rimosus]|nr:hypothetical protein ADK43_39960 [Streptomyces rimosus subsp. rimosus]